MSRTTSASMMPLPLPSGLYGDHHLARVGRGEQSLGAELGVVLHLVGEQLGNPVVQPCQHAGGHVADAELTDASLLAQPDERTECVDHGVVAAHRPVQEQQVEVVGAQRTHRPLGTVPHLVGLELAMHHLGGQPDIVSGDAGPRDALADELLVAVRVRGVDVAVPGVEGVADTLDGVVTLDLPGTETDRRHMDAADSGRERDAHAAHRR
jgi:hypothetical protein